MRNIRGVGIAAAMVAICVAGAASVPSASAAELTAEAYPVTITKKKSESSSETFSITAGPTTCKDTTGVATLKEKSTRVFVLAFPKECTGFGFPAEVHPNGCGFEFTLAGGASMVGTVDIVCPVGQEITVTAMSAGTAKCTVHVPSQSGLGTVTYSSIGSGATREVKVEAALSGISYTHTAGTGLGKCTAGSGTTGTFSGASLWTGETEPNGNHIGLFITAF